MNLTMRQVLQISICMACLNSCYSVQSMNPEFHRTFVLEAVNPEIYTVDVKLGGRLEKVQPSGHYEIFIPETKEGRSFILGVPVSGRKIQNRKSIWIMKNGQVHKKLSLAQLWRLPLNAAGHHVMKLP